MSLFPSLAGSLFQRNLAQSIEWKLHWLLRRGLFMEFVERGGSYVAPLAALCILISSSAPQNCRVARHDP